LIKILPLNAYALQGCIPSTGITAFYRVSTQDRHWLAMLRTG